MNAQQKRRAQTITLRNELRQERERVARYQAAAELSTKRDADRLSAITQKDEAIALKTMKINDLTAERDRLIRMVDQFTSISINTNNTPAKELRKT